MQRHHSNPPSESTHALGVLGRLMRAFPARAVADFDDLADATQQTQPTVANEHRTVAKPPRGLLARIESWVWRQQQRERETYLAEATDVADLEARMRVIDNRQARNQVPF